MIARHGDLDLTTSVHAAIGPECCQRQELISPYSCLQPHEPEVSKHRSDQHKCTPSNIRMRAPSARRLHVYALLENPALFGACL